MATKLTVYNDALQLCKERKLSAVDEATASRRYLDTAWDSGLLGSILEDTDWNFCMLVEKVDYDAAAPATEFGHDYTFSLPTDIARISGVYSDESLSQPLTNHDVEGDKIYASVQTLYLAYVPGATTVEADIANWPDTFARHVAGQLALDAVEQLSSGANLGPVASKAKIRERAAKSTDVQIKPTKRIPEGYHVRARRGAGYRFADRI
jgi:hypothetical protein